MRAKHFLVPLCLVAAVACRSNRETEARGSGSGIIDETVGESTTSATGVTARAPEAQDAIALAEAGYGFAQDSTQGDAEVIRRRMEQRRFLANEYLDKGDELLERADFEGALAAYASALRVDPGSERARTAMGRVEALMGDRWAGAADVIEDQTEREIVRIAQAQIEAERAAQKGDAALARGDYEEAVGHYREAELIVRYHPLIRSTTVDAELIGGKIQGALNLLEEAEAAAEEAARREARRAVDERERLSREQRENRLRTLYDEANTAFLNENFKRAESLVRQVLIEDPGNEAARNLLEVSREARHTSRQARNRRDYREQWQRTMDELATLNVPQSKSIQYDVARWREVSDRRPIEFSDLDVTRDVEKEVVLRRLDETSFPPNFGEDGEGAPIAEVASYLQSLTGINFVVSSKVRDELDEEETAIEMNLPERSVLNVLRIIGETKETLRWKIEDGVVKFVTIEEMTGGQVLRMYEVRDLIQPIRDFPGRDINVSPSGGLILPEEDIEERESNVVTADALETLITNTISAESWEQDEANSIAITELGTLIVNQTPEVHGQIQQLLDDLREATGILVDIQARFMKVEDSFLEDIGVDFRGLGAPGLGNNAFLDDFGDPSTQVDLGNEIGQGTDIGAFFDEGEDGDLRGRVEQLYDSSLGSAEGVQGGGGLSFQWTYINDAQLELILRAVSKSERVELVTAPRVLVYNTARANLTVLNQVAYVQDFNLEIAQAASIADPIIDVIQDGVILDVRPVVSADRRFVTLELRPTIAELQRPIREFVTTLGSQNSVTIQLPEVEIQRVRTSIPIPDQGTVMLGGMKVSDNQDFRSGVPILNKIPVISALFERKGNYISNRKLLILLKASIVIPEEHEPTPAQTGVGVARAAGM